MHGAALTYSLLQPPYGALLELWPQRDGMWRCFENTAQWSGLLYRRWANADVGGHQEGRDGDETVVDVGEVRWQMMLAACGTCVAAHRSRRCLPMWWPECTSARLRMQKRARMVGTYMLFLFESILNGRGDFGDG